MIGWEKITGTGTAKLRFFDVRVGEPVAVEKGICIESSPGMYPTDLVNAVSAGTVRQAAEVAPVCGWSDVEFGMTPPCPPCSRSRSGWKLFIGWTRIRGGESVPDPKIGPEAQPPLLAPENPDMEDDGSNIPDLSFLGSCR